MAKKKYVAVKCVAKDLFDSSLKSTLEKLMTATITKAIEKKSRSKLTTKVKSKEGFVLTAVLTLKVDDKVKPTKIDAKAAITVVAMGSTAKAFTGSKGGSIDGFGSKPKRAAGDLVIGVFESFMPKVISTILKL